MITYFYSNHTRPEENYARFACISSQWNTRSMYICISSKNTILGMLAYKEMNAQSHFILCCLSSLLDLLLLAISCVTSVGGGVTVSFCSWIKWSCKGKLMSIWSAKGDLKIRLIRAWWVRYGEHFRAFWLHILPRQHNRRIITSLLLVHSWSASVFWLLCSNITQYIAVQNSMVSHHHFIL